MINSRHTLSYCDECETDMVICADCGNNCCNAITGEINGKMCGCVEAYKHQDFYWQYNGLNIKFANDWRQNEPREIIA